MARITEVRPAKISVICPSIIVILVSQYNQAVTEVFRLFIWLTKYYYECYKKFNFIMFTAGRGEMNTKKTTAIQKENIPL